ncbi:MAG: hypothetical protein PHQ58_11345 [Rhodoferax sp.]|uniref:hypothetical protein n=1 Tax=Rhodoferax sp. TaxID=50421 RepID=UPI00260DD3E8|nr:hypothetical protein [Rhodoferax sp.]MDD2881024.1 hypothetical protein [Rhodoferax sp.]
MKPKLPKKRRLCLEVAKMLSPAEPPSSREDCHLVNTPSSAAAPDFPEGREDPEQSAELERQQDA